MSGWASGYRARVADDEIPQHLIAAQQRYDEASAAVKAASAGPHTRELDRLRQEQSAATMALIAARKGTPWESWDGQQQVHKAARAGG